MSDIFYGPGETPCYPEEIEREWCSPPPPPPSFDDFQKDAVATVPRDMTLDERMNFFAHALAEEFGEVYKPLSKHLRSGEPIDPVFMIDELGDLLNVITVVADTLGLRMEDIARANMRKRDKWRDK